MFCRASAINFRPLSGKSRALPAERKKLLFFVDSF
jgi:hypothetical protein